MKIVYKGKTFNEKHSFENLNTKQYTQRALQIGIRNTEWSPIKDKVLK